MLHQKGLEEIRREGQSPVYFRSIMTSSAPASVPLGRLVSRAIATVNDSQIQADAAVALGSGPGTEAAAPRDVPVASFGAPLAQFSFGEALASRGKGAVSGRRGGRGKTSHGGRKGGRGIDVVAQVQELLCRRVLDD